MRQLKEDELPTSYETQFIASDWHEDKWEIARVNYVQAVENGESPKSEEETTTPKSDDSEPEFDAPGTFPIRDPVFQRDVKEFEKREEQMKAAYQVYVYLKDLQERQRISLTARANEIWNAKEAVKEA